jgi:hypothetical protein
MLAVDGLDEFFLGQTDANDPTLAVNTLDELFAEGPIAKAEPEPEPEPEPKKDDSAPSDETLECGGLEDYFRNHHEAVGRDGDDSRQLDDMTCSVESANRDVTSQTQRAALEFQRFAEKFHAFAAECQHR